MIDRFSILPIRSLGQDVRWTSDASPSTVQDMRVDHRSGKVLLPRTLDLAALLRHMPRAPREPRPVDVLLMLNSTRDRKLTETQSHSHHQERPDTLYELAGIPVESFPDRPGAPPHEPPASRRRR